MAEETMDENVEEVPAFVPVTWTSTNAPSLKVQAEGKTLKFENGVYTCNTPEEAEAMQTAWDEAAPSAKQRFRKIDRDAALQVVQQHKQAMATAAVRGTASSMSAPGRAMGAAALEEAALKDVQVDADRDDMMLTETANQGQADPQPSAAPAAPAAFTTEDANRIGTNVADAAKDANK